MSWETKKLKIKTAKRDIPVWKVVYRDESSYGTECYALYHRNYYYLKGEVQHSCMHFININNRILGFEGYHSYSKKLKPIITEECIYIRKKYLWGSRKQVIELYPNQRCIKIAEFCIPKGSPYVINEKGEIISDTIIFKNIID